MRYSNIDAGMGEKTPTNHIGFILEKFLIQSKFSPHGAVVRGFGHGADGVIDTGTAAVLVEGSAGKDKVDTQTAFGIALKAAAAVVKPAVQTACGGIDARWIGMAGAVGVLQTDVHQGMEPVTLFGEKAAFPLAQPALFILRSDADIRICGSNIHIPHYHKHIR